MSPAATTEAAAAARKDRLATLGVVAACVAVCAFAGGNLLAREASLAGSVLAMYRLYLSFVIAMVILTVTGGRMSWRALRLSLPGGIAFGTNLACFFTAIQLTSVVSATLIGNLQPALVLLAAGPLFGEKVGRAEVGLTAAAIAGTGVVLLGGKGGIAGGVWGNILAVAGLLFWTAYFLLSKQARQQLGALEYQAAVSLIGALVITPVVVPLALAQGNSLALDGGRVGWVLALALVPGTGHLLLNWAHPHTPVTVLSLLTLGIPLLVTIGARVVLDDAVTGVQWVAIIATTSVLAVLVGRRH